MLLELSRVFFLTLLKEKVQIIAFPTRQLRLLSNIKHCHTCIQINANHVDTYIPV